MKKFQIKVQILMNEKGKVSVNWRRKDTDLDSLKIAGLPKHEKII